MVKRGVKMRAAMRGETEPVNANEAAAFYKGICTGKMIVSIKKLRQITETD